MPKAIRPHAPGQYFHLTARTQNKTHWFDEDLCPRIDALIRESALVTGTPIAAYVVMSNHVHIVVRQAQAPLGWLMHRVLHQTALMVKRKFNPDGHVFGRRFWSGWCDDVYYARQAIIYTHLNPFYAGLCTHPSEYAWSSHRDYLELSSPGSLSISADLGMPLFGAYETTVESLRESYVAHIDYWRARPRLPLGFKYIWTEEERRSAPWTMAGNTYWATSQQQLPLQSCATPHKPVYDAAVEILHRLDPDISITQVRLAGRMRALLRARRNLIAALLSRGYRGSAIARCLNVSAALVSTIKREIAAGLMPMSELVTAET